MCSARAADTHGSSNREDRYPDHGDDGPPDWETMPLPPAHILAHLTDAHCHPTDTSDDPSHPDYEACQLGGLATMATIPEDQQRVERVSQARAVRAGTSTSQVTSSRGGHDDGAGSASDAESSTARMKGPRTIACFGYHPWFTHRYTLHDPTPSREEHYFSLFLPSAPRDAASQGSTGQPVSAVANDETNTSHSVTGSSSNASERNADLLRSLLPHLPDPIPFSTLLSDLRSNIHCAKEEGRAVMLGEVGLDGAARMRWPPSARHLYPERYPQLTELDASDVPHTAEASEEEEHEWRRLTPFKVPIAHQRAIVELQMGVAVEEGVNVSFHSVAAAGPSMDVLLAMRKKWGHRFTYGINVDIHSGGGWRPEFWTQAERTFPNLYASPSILITGRSTTAPALIQAISPDRILVESDMHDVAYTTRLVWGAAEWVARVKGWRLEGRDGEETEWYWGPDGRGTSMENGRRKATGKEAGGIGDEEVQNGKDQSGEGESGDSESDDSGDLGRGVDRIDSSIGECGPKFRGQPQTEPKRDERGHEGASWTLRRLECNWKRFMRSSH